MLNRIISNDKDILDLIETLKANENFKTSFLRDGKIYSYPFLFSQLEIGEREKLNITNMCNAYCIVYNYTEDEKYYLLNAYTFIDEISMFDFDSITYKTEIEDVHIDKKIIQNFSHDTDGISTVINNGLTIRIPKSYDGEITISINYKGLKKEAYVCTLSNELSFDFTKLNIDFKYKFHKLFKFEVLSNNEFIINSLVRHYDNVPDFKVYVERKRNKLISKHYELKLDEKYFVDNFISNNSHSKYHLSFYFKYESEKYAIKYSATIGDVYHKKNFFLDINGNLKYRLHNSLRFKDFMKQKAWSHKRFNTLIRRILFFKRIRPIKPDNSIIDKCIDFENDNKLLKMSFAKTLPWQIGRFFILVDIDNMFNGQREMFAGKKMQISKLDKTEIGAMLFNLKQDNHNPFINKPKNSILIIDNLRKSKVDNEYIDIASHYYIKNILSNNNKEIIVCDNDYLYNHLSKEPNRAYLDGFNIFLRKYKMHSFRIPVITNSEELDKLSEKFISYTGVKYNFKKRMLTWSRRHIFEYTYNFHLFNELIPSEAYVVGPYRQWIYHVANDFNVKSYEFQYAAIENGHLGYAFKKSNYLKADTMVVWSDFWEKEVSKYNKYNYITYPYEYFYRKIKQSENVEIKYDVLFLSQNAIGDELLKFAFEFAKNNPDLRILYRLHPHEEVSLYSIAKDCNKLANFTFTDFHREDVYKSLSVSKFVTGVYSTTTIEAFAMNKPIALLNMPGIEYMKSFVNDFDEINVYSSIKELRLAYDSITVKKTDRHNAEKIFGAFV